MTEFPPILGRFVEGAAATNTLYAGGLLRSKLPLGTRPKSLFKHEKYHSTPCSISNKKVTKQRIYAENFKEFLREY